MDKKIEEEFLEKFEDCFQESFEDYKRLKLSKSTEYKDMKKKILTIKSEYPKVELALEKKAVGSLTEEEVKKLVEIINIEEDIKAKTEVLAYKLGFKIACQLLSE